LSSLKLPDSAAKTVGAPQNAKGGAASAATMANPKIEKLEILIF
jgi:hypothetical protein